MWNLFKSRPGAPDLNAAADPLQGPFVVPKVKPNQKTYPGFFTSVKMAATALAKAAVRHANVDANSLRNGASDSQIIRDFSRASPDLSAAVSAYLRTGIPSGYTAIAKNRDGTILVQQLLSMINVLPDYTEGFSNTQSIRSLAEQLGQEILWEGAAGLVLIHPYATASEKQSLASIKTRLAVWGRSL